MYGTIFHMKVKPGQHKKVVGIFESWDRERKPNVQGVKANFLMKPDGKTRDLIGVAVFENKLTLEIQNRIIGSVDYVSCLRTTLNGKTENI